MSKSVPCRLGTASIASFETPWQPCLLCVMLQPSMLIQICQMLMSCHKSCSCNLNVIAQGIPLCRVLRQSHFLAQSQNKAFFVFTAFPVKGLHSPSPAAQVPLSNTSRDLHLLLRTSLQALSKGCTMMAMARAASAACMLRSLLSSMCREPCLRTA